MAEKDDREQLSRREFLGVTIAALGTGVGLGGPALAAGPADGMPRRILGRTGENVSILGVGGYHASVSKDERETIKIIRTAIDSGVTFMDNCWDYHGGDAESRMGLALKDGYRKKVFLMSKVDGRKKSIALKQIDDCLRRLKTDVIDLMQFHEVIKKDEPDTIFGANGAIEALLEAKKAGKIRYIGFTGHKSPAVHNRMLDVASQHNFVFDAVQMPLNLMDAHYDSFEKLVLPRLKQQNIAVLGMKPLCAGMILRSNAVTATECLQYAMSIHDGVVITGMESMRDLEQGLHAAKTFKPMTAELRASLLSKTAALAAKGKYELYKTTYLFDATRFHPEWMS